MSSVSRHLNYMHNPKFQNILALLDIHDFVHVSIISVHSGFFNATEIEIPQSVNGDDSSDNAP